MDINEFTISQSVHHFKRASLREQRAAIAENEIAVI